ncbi:glutaredoxin domain-containing protein [Pseudomonadota bacterium]
MKIVAIYFATSFIVIPYSSSVSADMYKWTDKYGVVHFSDQKPVHQEPEFFELKSINTYVETQDTSNTNSYVNNVVMYSTKWCGVCKRAKAYFRNHNIAFTEYDIEESQSACKEFNRNGGRGVPLILLGNIKMHGFNEQRLRKLWKAK